MILTIHPIIVRIRCAENKESGMTQLYMGELAIYVVKYINDDKVWMARPYAVGADWTINNFFKTKFLRILRNLK